GDFIEMEGGVRGYVVEVGWRSTRIRTPFNNLVVMPNSRIADSILTNYSEPSTEMGMMVEAGVSYSSNLAHVREVVLEEASQLIEEMPEADKKTQPRFGYERFGDSNVDFWVWLQSKDRISSFALKTELMIRLHERFAREGIEINYPVRKLVY
ncbi:MAG: mechanosensitive ion channel family protein, partial [Chloroflexi bacterium]|nr:mechanosensitive ion channel family protein [Chloroflexota bacterium]